MLKTLNKMTLKQGGILGKTNTPTGPSSTNAATGVWTLTEQENHEKDGNWPHIPIVVDYLVIAGGGSGGGCASYINANAGGGGAGGYRCSISGESSGGGASAESPLTLLDGTAYSVIVGAGGSGSLNSGTNGSNSKFHTVESTGGGKGAHYTSSASTGGSGGGALATSPINTGASGTANQGYGGGNASISGTLRGGGGGGAGGAGVAGSTSGNGGIGVQSTIDGTTTYRAGGGGGAYHAGTPGSGGSGGGGTGAGSSGNGANGTINTGGGGGAGSTVDTSSGGNGGRGVVILRVPSNKTATFSVGVTAELSQEVEGYNVYTVTETSTVDETVIFS